MHKFKLFTCNVNACIYVWYESIQGTVFCGEKHHVLNEIVQTLYFNKCELQTPKLPSCGKKIQGGNIFSFPG